MTNDPSESPDHPVEPVLDTPVAELPVASLRGQDVDPASMSADEDDESRLPEQVDDQIDLASEGTLAVGRAAIERAVKLAPTSPGVYRMLNAANDCCMSARRRASKNVSPPTRVPPGTPRASRE